MRSSKHGVRFPQFPRRVEASFASASVHDFAVTARHLVFLLPPLRFSFDKFRAGTTFNESHEWIADAPLRVLNVEKADLHALRLFELPSGFVFHLGNACEDKGGSIRFDYVHAD